MWIPAVAGPEWTALGSRLPGGQAGSWLEGISKTVKPAKDLACFFFFFGLHAPAMQTPGLWGLPPNLDPHLRWLLSSSWVWVGCCESTQRNGGDCSPPLRRWSYTPGSGVFRALLQPQGHHLQPRDGLLSSACNPACCELAKGEAMAEPPAPGSLCEEGGVRCTLAGS